MSHHLRSLKQLGVITSRRIGKEVHYTIADTADGELVSDLLKTVFERRVFMKKTYEFENLGCAHCAGKMEEKIGKLPDVKSVNLSFPMKKNVC